MFRALASRFDVFGRAPAFRRLLLAGFASGLGTWLAFVALSVDVYNRTGSATWVSILLIADFLPSVAIGLLLGPLVDRLSRRRIMLASNLVNCAIFAALPFAPSVGAIVALAAVSGFATGFFRPALYAGMPNLVAEADLENANSLWQTVENLTTLGGPLVGGLLVATAGPHDAYWLNSVSFLVSALLVSRIPALALQSEESYSRGHLRDLADGFRIVRSSRALFTVLVAWNVVCISNAAVNVGEIVLAKVVLHGGSFGFGLLVATAGLGLACGSFGSSWAIARLGVGEVYATAIGMMALGIGAAARAPSIWVAAACVVVSGAGNGAAVVCNALFIQRGAPDRLRGRAVTVLMSSTQVTLTVAMVAAGRLTDVAGARWVWGAAAGVAAVGAVAGLVLGRGVADRAVEPAPELALEAPATVY